VVESRREKGKEKEEGRAQQPACFPFPLSLGPALPLPAQAHQPFLLSTPAQCFPLLYLLSPHGPPRPSSLSPATPRALLSFLSLPGRHRASAPPFPFPPSSSARPSSVFLPRRPAALPLAVAPLCRTPRALAPHPSPRPSQHRASFPF
jgi:hypothetical protein